MSVLKCFRVPNYIIPPDLNEVPSFKLFEVRESRKHIGEMLDIRKHESNNDDTIEAQSDSRRLNLQIAAFVQNFHEQNGNKKEG